MSRRCWPAPAPLAARQDQVAYDEADTLRWLGWLAEQMGAESVFYPDWMQPDWLPTPFLRWLATTGLGLVSGLAVWLTFGLAFGLADQLADGLIFGLIAGLGVGLTGRGSQIEPIEPTRWAWSTARHHLALALALGLVLGLAFGLASQARIRFRAAA